MIVRRWIRRKRGRSSFSSSAFKRMIAQITLAAGHDVDQLAFGLKRDDFGRIQQVRSGRAGRRSFVQGPRLAAGAGIGGCLRRAFSIAFSNRSRRTGFSR